ncbi:uncharacterized protein RSE6_11788 [Rhynchosporium secalis]|uniref:Uncharacterized protein n=1 Tax=Rhynchosporium secalis TaxID=38038 RepID=A0A1E1MNV3_RHYSE|nr:uncharacterized protein RSE6_11788 [Rhynchosporium secalis]
MDTFETSGTILSRADVVLTNLFLNPPKTGANGPDNTEFSIGTQQQLRWKTNITSYDLMLYQQLGCGDKSCINGPFLIADNLTNETKSWDWQVTTGSLTLKPTNTFFLRVRDAKDESNLFDSSTLDFTSSGPAGGDSPSAPSVTTSSTPSPKLSSTPIPKPTSPVSTKPTTTIAVTTSSTPSASVSRASSTSVPPASPTIFISSTAIADPTSISTALPTSTAIPAPPKGGSSPATKVGIAIGVTLLVVIAIFLGWYLNRRRKARSRKSSLHSFETPSSADPAQLSGPHELHVPGWGEQRPIVPFTPRELHGNGKFDAVKGVRELEAWEKPGELGNRNLDDFESMRELEAWDKPGELGDVKLDDFEYVRELETWERPGELGNRNLDDFEGVRELEARERPAELGDWRRSGIKSGIYELES